MGQFEQNKPTEGSAPSPPPPVSTGPGVYSAPAPPAGYPTFSVSNQHPRIPLETKSKGDGFWKGCCAALCCCCAIDICF